MISPGVSTGWVADMRASFVMSGVATGLRRNLSMTIALILSTAISLGFLGAALMANRFIGKFQTDYQDRLSVTIYMCTAQPDPASTCTGRYTDAQAAALEKKLKSDPQILSVTFFTEQQSYERGKKTLPPASAANLQPGVLPALFQLKLKNVEKDYDAVRARYIHQPGVGDIQNQSDALRTILTLFNQVRIGSLVVAAIVLISAIILMANTIQVAAQHRRNETSIMRLVGASRWVTQLPFMIEAVIAALAGALIAIGFDFAGRYALLDKVFGAQVQNKVLPDITTNDVLLAGGVGLIAGVALAAITAYTTLRLAVKI